MGREVKFHDALGAKIEDRLVVIRCDAGSIETMEQSKSQFGVAGMIQSRRRKGIYPEDNSRTPDLKGDRELVKAAPYIKDAPIVCSSKSERVDISSFAAGLLAARWAFGAGTLPLLLYSELIHGPPAGFAPVEIRNGQISVVDALNGNSAIQTDRKLAGAIRCVREMVGRCEIASAAYSQALFNMADALTKSVLWAEIVACLLATDAQLRPFQTFAEG